VRDLNFAASSYFLSSLDEGWEVGIKKSGRNFCFSDDIFLSSICRSLKIENKELI